MKPVLLALILSVSLAVSAQAGDRHKGNNRVVYKSGQSGAVQNHSAPSFRHTEGRTFAPSPRFTTRSMPTFSQHHVVSGENIVPHQFTRRTFSERTGNDLAQFQHNRPIHSDRFTEIQGGRHDRTAQLETGGRNRTIGNISPGHNHVFAQRSADWNRNWDRRRDHFWNGHRCRFVNGSWFIFDIGFFPWFGWPFYDYYAYDYYPYGYGYGYDSGAYYGSYYGDNQGGYDSSYYNQGGYDSSYYNQGGYDSSYSNGNRYGSSDRSGAAALVADVQDTLQREGYYRGQIDGVLGPETRHAIVRYQSDKGLEPSGNLTSETLRSLGLRQSVAQD